MAHLLYFAALAERLGSTAEEVALPAEVHDVRMSGRRYSWTTR